METTQAIQILETESQNIGANIGKESNLQTAIDLATSQLKSTLVTQLADLEATKAKLDEATATIATLQDPAVLVQPTDVPLTP